MGGIFIERNNKIPILITLAILFVAGVLGTAAYSLSNDIVISLQLDGENVTVSSLAIPFGKNIREMEDEILDYTTYEMNSVDSNITTLKSGISEIARQHGFNNIIVDIESQFGKDELPMIVVVDGTSMFPTLENGEKVIILKTKNIQVGDIVVAKDPEYKLLIKRVGKISGDKVFLSADNNNTETFFHGGTYYQLISVEKWTNASNIVGVAKIFNV